MIELTNVSLHFPRSPRRILHDINWRIGNNEKWVLFGRNGSGKTRLLEIITGYLFPSTGEVTRFGQRQGESDIRELRRRIGYVSTSLKEQFHQSERVIDVVLSGLFASIGLYDEPTAADEAHARELLDTAGLAERAPDRFGILSDGEKQKVLFMRAMINRPDLLVMDEAAKGLDLGAREDFLSTIGRLSARREFALVYVTHHTEEITPLFGRLFILDDGQCFFQGTVREGLDADRLTALFGRRVTVREYDRRYYTILES